MNAYLCFEVSSSGRVSESEYWDGFVIARYEYGIDAHLARPLCARTTWKEWISCRCGLWVTSRRSVSPLVPTVE